MIDEHELNIETTQDLVDEAFDFVKCRGFYTAKDMERPARRMEVIYLTKLLAEIYNAGVTRAAHATGKNLDELKLSSTEIADEKV
jgi:hypothetical protein